MASKKSINRQIENIRDNIRTEKKIDRSQSDFIIKQEKRKLERLKDELKDLREDKKKSRVSRSKKKSRDKSSNNDKDKSGDLAKSFQREKQLRQERQKALERAGVFNQRGEVKVSKIKDFNKITDKFSRAQTTEAFRRRGGVVPTIVRKDESLADATKRAARKSSRRIAESERLRTGKDVVVSVEAEIPIRQNNLNESNQSIANIEDLPADKRFSSLSVQDLEINRLQSLARPSDLKRVREVSPNTISAASSISDIRKEQGLSASLSEQRRRLLVGSEDLERKGGFENELKAFSSGVASSGLGLASGLSFLGEAGISRVKNPSLLLSDIRNLPRAITKIPGAIERAGASFGSSLRTRPITTSGEVAAEILGPSILRRAGRTVSGQTSRFRDDFLPTQRVTGRGARITKEGVVNRASFSDDIIRNIPDRATGEVRDVTIRQGAASTAEDLATQTSRAGTTVTGVSAQSGLVPRTLSDIGETSIKLRKVTDDLEQTFFADPASRLRTSRLGGDKRSFAERSVDFATEPFNINFRGDRPQAFVFSRADIEDFPSDLKNAIRKDPSLKSLTAKQTQRLQDFQLEQRSGFTSPGFISEESEIVTTSPRIIVERSATARIGGRRVPIFSSRTADDLVDSDIVRNKRLGKRDITRQASRDVKTGFDADVLSLSRFNKSFDSALSDFSSDFNRLKSFDSGLSRVDSSQSVAGFSDNVVSPVKSSSFSKSVSDTGFSAGSVSGFSNAVTPRTPKSPSGLTGRGSFTPRTPRSPTRSKKPKKQQNNFEKQQKKTQGYNAFAKTKNEWVKVNNKALTKRAAKTAMFKAVDNTASASGKIRRANKKVKNKKDFLSGFNIYEDKFRYKKDKDVYIEKNKYRIDTVGELQGITAKGLYKKRTNNNNMRFDIL